MIEQMFVSDGIPGQPAAVAQVGGLSNTFDLGDLLVTIATVQ